MRTGFPHSEGLSFSDNHDGVMEESVQEGSRSSVLW
jgi:hypothetical protein